VLAGDRIVCPWHAACFSATTGDIEDGPVVDKLATYKTKVAADGQILVEIPKGTTAVPSKGVAPRTCKHDPAADTRTFVIIGGGAAALAAIESLREHGYAGRIVLVSKEGALPYDRPKLSKNMALTPADVTLRNADWFARLGVELRLGETVTEVRPASRQVALAGGALLAYDKLLCCSGGYPRRFVAPERFVTPGADLRNVFPLRDLAHAQGIEAAIDAAGGPAACPVVIVGSSFIGMEAAAYLKANKGVASVTVIGMEAVPFERVLGREIGGYMEAMHRGRGVQFRLPATVAEFRPSVTDAGAVGSVVLKSGEELPAGVVIIGAGIIPSTEYLAGEEAKAAGIEVLAGAPGGVKVNAQLQTGCADVFAAGDLAYFPYTPRGAAAPLWTRIEHWDVAYDQGRTAGRNMVGEGVAYGAVPFFWTQSYGKSLREWRRAIAAAAAAVRCLRGRRLCNGGGGRSDPLAAQVSTAVFRFG
jgi:NADPH-dependent 2,4-dienoyl-CoA reductase/sulfur reductase-like enzyme